MPKAGCRQWVGGNRASVVSCGRRIDRARINGSAARCGACDAPQSRSQTRYPRLERLLPGRPRRLRLGTIGLDCRAHRYERATGRWLAQFLPAIQCLGRGGELLRRAPGRLQRDASLALRGRGRGRRDGSQSGQRGPANRNRNDRVGALRGAYVHIGNRPRPTWLWVRQLAALYDRWSRVDLRSSHLESGHGGAGRQCRWRWIDRATIGWGASVGRSGLASSFHSHRTGPQGSSICSRTLATTPQHFPPRPSAPRPISRSRSCGSA